MPTSTPSTQEIPHMTFTDPTGAKMKEFPTSAEALVALQQACESISQSEYFKKSTLPADYPNIDDCARSRESATGSEELELLQDIWVNPELRDNEQLSLADELGAVLRYISKVRNTFNTTREEKDRLERAAKLAMEHARLYRAKREHIRTE